MSKERRSRKPWNTSDLAYLGAFFGMGIAGVHVFLHISRGELPSEGAFLHILPDLLAGTVGAASLFASISGLRNWVARE